MSVRHGAQVGGCDFDIPKFMLLGARGGGQPIRVALFAGIEDRGALDGMAAITRLLIQAELDPALVRDYAIFAYPLVNVFEYKAPAGKLSRLTGAWRMSAWTGCAILPDRAAKVAF